MSRHDRLRNVEIFRSARHAFQLNDFAENVEFVDVRPELASDIELRLPLNIVIKL